MSESKTIVPVEQKMVSFYDDEIIAVRLPDDVVYVPLRPICDLIGVDWGGQAKKVNNDPILSQTIASVEITLRVDDARKQITSKMTCIPLDYLNGWLFGINANRVKESIRESLMRYQKDCYRVLFDAFGRNDVAVRHDEELIASSSPEGSAYRVALAVARLARQQYYLSKRVDGAEQKIGELDHRLALIESNMGEPQAFITESQAQQLAGAVKLIATLLSKRSGKNEFGGVYGELYRRFGITSYKRLPAVRFEQAMEWLRNWWSDISEDQDIPF